MLFTISLLFVAYFFIDYHTDKSIEKAIDHYAKAVDSVIFERDKKIEELEDRINDLQLQINKLKERNK